MVPTVAHPLHSFGGSASMLFIVALLLDKERLFLETEIFVKILRNSVLFLHTLV